MEFNNNNHKDLNRGDQPLPPELEWRNMKDGILAKMHSIEQAELSHPNNQDAKKRTWLFLSLLLTLSLALTAGLVFFFQAETTDQGPATAVVAPLPEAAIAEGGSSAIDWAATPPQDGHAEADMGEAASPRPLRQAGAETASFDGQQRPPSAERDWAPWSATLTTSEQDRAGLLSDSTRVDAPQIASEKAKIIHRTLRPWAVLPAAKLTLDIPEVRASMPANPDLTHLSEAHHASSGSQEMDSAALPLIPRTRPVNQLILEGGMNFWGEGYGNAKPDRARYEAPIPSFQLQGYYMKGLKDGYFLMAGLQYQQLESRLEYRSTIEDYQITLQDTILQVRQNLLTGEETIIRGDAVQSVQAERRIKHYNKTQLFKASLAMGKSWRFRSVQTDVYLGGALNGLVRNQGRMFFGDEIIDYSGTANPFFQNRWTVEGVAGARLHYFPYQNLGITAGFQAQRSLMNWSHQTDVRFYPLSFGLQVGLSYAL